MKIANVRLGFATNSSSSHSIVLLPEHFTLIGDDPPSSPGEFGWEYFVLSKSNSKMAYLAAAVGQSLIAQYGINIAAPVMKEWFCGLAWDDDWYIDHSSLITMPVDSSTGEISKTFIDDMKLFMIRSDVVVLGGNDDSEMPDEHAELISNSKTPLDFDLLATYKPQRAIRSGEWWSLFNPTTGAKMRFSFNPDASDLIRSSVPELVDLKITDFCTFGCKFCYQNSTPKGEHAPTQIVKNIITGLSNLGVFEIAIGGGEPTSHPDIVDIMQHAHHANVIPNITTKVMPEDWTPEFLSAVKLYAGGVAISIATPEQLEEIDKWKKSSATAIGIRGKINVHFVVGAYPKERLAAVLGAAKELHIPITLLGYKEIGRGAPRLHGGKTVKNRKPQDITPKLFQNVGRVAVDTAFVDEYGDVLKQVQVPEILVVPGEGRFSMYIDAVSRQAGPSSYHPEKLEPFDIPSQLRRIWNTMSPV